MEFQPFPKMPRWHRECIITEKIDGTNAQLYIDAVHPNEYKPEPGMFAVETDGAVYMMKAGSRNRWLTREADNFGFCNWAFDNGETLVRELGPGRHFGEWWGRGIQRGYGLQEKRFSLFNVNRWQGQPPALCYQVPVLYVGLMGDAPIDITMAMLRERGSFAAPGFMQPEGVILYHVAGNFAFKKTFEKDEAGKGE
jgi:hypothetical protein